MCEYCGAREGLGLCMDCGCTICRGCMWGELCPDCVDEC
ncbi:hypothetical protein D2E22_0227 [Bifidobacterium castoris]|uniref:Uncharacterized protein n=1 Tax=Bifidobacterium castoris TaxID=2306972 RepID=A0A430FAB5_9BIFI|nr:hypothetical protein D2E22_0227 [Bifidobacterium castoris]